MYSVLRFTKRIKYILFFIIVFASIFIRCKNNFSFNISDSIIKVVNPINDHIAYYNNNYKLLFEIDNDKTVVDYISHYDNDNIDFVVKIDCSKSVYIPKYEVYNLNGDKLNVTDLPFSYIKNKIDKQTMFDYFINTNNNTKKEIFENNDKFYKYKNYYIAEKSKFYKGRYNHFDKHYDIEVAEKNNDEEVISFYDNDLKLIKEIKNYSLVDIIEKKNNYYYIVKNEKYDDVSVDVKYIDRYKNATVLYNIMDANFNILLDKDATDIHFIDEEEVNVKDYFRDYKYNINKKQIVNINSEIDYNYTELNDNDIWIYNKIEIDNIIFNFVQGNGYYTIVDNDFKYLNKHFDGIIDYKEAYGDKFLIIRDKNKTIYQTIDGKKLNNDYNINDIKFYGFGYYAIYSHDRQKITMFNLSDKDFSKDFVSASLSEDAPNTWPVLYNLNTKIYIEYKNLIYDKNCKIIPLKYQIENILIDVNYNDYIMFRIDKYETKILDYNLNEIYTVNDDVVSVKKHKIKNSYIYVIEYADSKNRGYDIYNFDFTKSLISSKNNKIEQVEVVGNFIKFKLNNFVYSLYLDSFTRIKNINKVDVDGDTDFIFSNEKVLDSIHLENVYTFDKKIDKITVIKNGEYYMVRYTDKMYGLYKSNFNKIIDNVLKINIYVFDNEYKYFTFLLADRYCLCDYDGNILHEFSLE